MVCMVDIPVPRTPAPLSPLSTSPMRCLLVTPLHSVVGFSTLFLRLCVLLFLLSSLFTTEQIAATLLSFRGGPRHPPSSVSSLCWWGRVYSSRFCLLYDAFSSSFHLRCTSSSSPPLRSRCFPILCVLSSPPSPSEGPVSFLFSSTPPSPLEVLCKAGTRLRVRQYSLAAVALQAVATIGKEKDMSCGDGAHKNLHGGLLHEWGCASESANFSEGVFPSCGQRKTRHAPYYKHRHRPHSRSSAASLLVPCPGREEAGETRQRQQDAIPLHSSGRQEMHPDETFSSNTHKTKSIFCLAARARSRKTSFARASTSAGELLPLFREESERSETETPQASFAELEFLSPHRDAQLLCLDEGHEKSEDEELQRLLKKLQQQGFSIRTGSSKENNDYEMRLKKTNPQQRRDVENHGQLRQGHQQEDTSVSPETEDLWDMKTAKDSETRVLLHETKDRHRKQKTNQSSRKKGEENYDDVIDKIEAWSLRDDEEDREERLRMEGRDPGSLLEAAKKKKKQEASSDFVPEVYVQSACLAVEPGTCSGCGTLLQCFDPRNPGYVSPALLHRGGGGKGGMAVGSSSPSAAAAAALVTEGAAARDATAAAVGRRSEPRRDNAVEKKEEHFLSNILPSKELKASAGVLSGDDVSVDCEDPPAVTSYDGRNATEAAANADATASKKARLAVDAGREGGGLHYAGGVAAALREERSTAGVAGEKKNKAPMYDMSALHQAARAFEAAEGDPEKLTAMAAEAELVDFHAFAAAMASALGVSEQEVAEKLSFACDYNSEDDGGEEEEEETQKAKLLDGEASERRAEARRATKRDVDAGDGRVDTRNGDKETTERETDTKSKLKVEHTGQRGDMTMQEDVACLKTLSSPTAAAGNAPEADKTLGRWESPPPLQASRGRGESGNRSHAWGERIEVAGPCAASSVLQGSEQQDVLLQYSSAPQRHRQTSPVPMEISLYELQKGRLKGLQLQQRFYALGRSRQSFLVFADGKTCTAVHSADLFLKQRESSVAQR